MTSLNSKLKLALINRKKGRNLLEKGFTLVELMIVIVIVGVLSAVALPNFLSQTGKAKATEAKSQISAINKDAAALYQQGGSSEIDVTGSTCENLGGPADDVQLFNYTCAVANDVLTVTAVGNDKDSSITDETLVMELNLATGITTVDKAKTDKIFGGSK